MTHARSQIRKYIISLLNDSTVAGSNVFEARIYGLDNIELPAILVFTNEENIQEYSIGHPRNLLRQLNVVIEIYAKASGNIDDVIDNLCMQIEQLLGSDNNLGGMVKDMILSSVSVSHSAEAERPLATATLNYQIIYSTKEHQPEAII